MAPRSRMPLSPSMEARLSNSQDSLISTGSNQELKTQLASTLAEVEAIAEQLEKQKKPPLEKSPSDSLNKPKPTVRRKASEQILSSNGGARPRDQQQQPSPLSRTGVTASSASELSTPSPSSEPGVKLRQSSWASREHISSGKLTAASPLTSENPAVEKRSFSKNKNMWERRTSAQSTGGLASTTSTAAASEEGVRGGFRSNRDFWNQRAAMKQKQTPDLVLDLPAGTVPKPKPRPRAMTSDMSSSNSSSGEENSLTADQFAKPDRDTLRKSSSKSNTPTEDTNPSPKSGLGAASSEKKQLSAHAKLRKNPPK